MRLTFDSELKTSRLNTTQWNPFPNQPVTINDELEEYIPAQVKTSPLLGLRLITQKQSYMGKDYVSGQVSTRGLFSQAYGHFEMRAKVPQADGMWPAFWLLPENNAWPPEIDVLEYIYAPYGHMPTASQNLSHATETLIWKGENGSNQQASTATSTPLNWGSDYHNYAIDWRPGSLVWEIDGKVVDCVIDTSATGTRVPNQSMFMIINDAISHPNGWPGTLQASQKLPLEFDVAYVRAYQFSDVPAGAPLVGAVRNTTLSSSTVAPGGVVKIMSNLVVGSTTLGDSVSYVQIKSYDGSKSIATLSASAYLAANSTTPISVSYSVPDSMAPGMYVVSVWTSYNNGADHFFNPEAQVITVASPPSK
jgi:beta-glucanase (GH16 family)